MVIPCLKKFIHDTLSAQQQDEDCNKEIHTFHSKTWNKQNGNFDTALKNVGGTFHH